LIEGLEKDIGNEQDEDKVKDCAGLAPETVIQSEVSAQGIERFILNTPAMASCLAAVSRRHAAGQMAEAYHQWCLSSMWSHCPATRVRLCSVSWA